MLLVLVVVEHRDEIFFSMLCWNHWLWTHGGDGWASPSILSYGTPSPLYSSSTWQCLSSLWDGLYTVLTQSCWHKVEVESVRTCASFSWTQTWGCWWCLSNSLVHSGMQSLRLPPVWMLLVEVVLKLFVRLHCKHISTYQILSLGLQGKVSGSHFSKSSIKRLATMGERGEPIAAHVLINFCILCIH